MGGIGINAAIGDAVEAANVLTDSLRAGTSPATTHLAEVQQRRARATKTIQTIQLRIQNTIVKRALNDLEFDLPLPVKLMLRTPVLRDIPARVFALGLNRLRLENP